MDNQVFKVTKDWIHKNKTKRGGFTKAQIIALGVSYPPRAGWIQELDGELITSEQARSFEQGKNSFSKLKCMKMAKVLSTLDSMNKDQLDHVVKHVKHIKHLRGK